jgi:hypothetical protein
MPMWFWSLIFRISDLFRISDFDIRTSLPHCILANFRASCNSLLDRMPNFGTIESDYPFGEDLPAESEGW